MPPLARPHARPFTRRPLSLNRRRLNDSKLNRLVNGNLSLFSAGEEREQLCTLASGPSDYLCRWWPPPGRKDDAKRALVAAAAAGAAPEELEEQRLGECEERRRRALHARRRAE